VKHISDLGEIYGAIEQFPTSASISGKLEKAVLLPLSPTVAGETWKGCLKRDSTEFLVVIKSFSAWHYGGSWENVKKVRSHSPCEFGSPTEFTDNSATGTGVGKTKS
jgi:hypothetical protein